LTASGAGREAAGLCERRTGWTQAWWRLGSCPPSPFLAPRGCAAPPDAPSSRAG